VTWKNKLYFGDNLPILREHIADESVDLVYLRSSVQLSGEL
jgi:site-specific DNA-methyltransferase (adenine-specific)